MNAETKQRGLFGARNQKTQVQAGPIRFVVLVESVMASIVKDSVMALLVIGVWLALHSAGAEPGYIAGVMTPIGVIALLIIVMRRTLKNFVSVQPEAALDYIEQELEEALAEAKQKGDRI